MDVHWMTATEMAKAIATKELSSREALDALVSRIKALDGSINSVVQYDLERANEAAAAADRAVIAGERLGSLHGVPMTIKDSFATRGCITTSGATVLADYVPEADAWPVARLREAGAIPFAKTNLPEWAGDIQTFNDVYGTTNNPFDPTRTPGGSSGGAAAALAMGFTPLELGSDIGGSIRVPAHYTGVMGHKPSYAIVPDHGHIPGPPGSLSGADLAVCGPMARSAKDLMVAMDVLAGPDRWNTPAWKLKLPAPRARKLSDFRIAAWINDDFSPPGSETVAELQRLCVDLRNEGATVDDSARPSLTLEQINESFMRLLLAALSPGQSLEEIEQAAKDDSPSRIGEMRRATAMRHAEWLLHNETRLQHRQAWSAFFEDYDAVLMPVHPCPAIKHDHHPSMEQRTIEIDSESRPYMSLFDWIAPAGEALLPATVVPVSRDRSGLPIGVQIVGPYLHDRTTLRLAELISKLRGGCPRPLLAR